MMYFDNFLLGFLVCALIAGGLAAMYLDYVKKEEDLLRQQMAIEMVRDLDAAKLRHLLGNADLPPWILFSDFERAEWATQILTQLWPYLDSAVSDRGKERLDKALKERRARWMLDVAVEQFALGTRAPQVSGIKVFKSAAQGGSDADDVTIEIELLWGGNPDISLMIKPLPAILRWMGVGPVNLAALFQARVAVRNLVFIGTLHIVLTPLLNSLPVIGAVHVAFASIPSLRFDLRLLGGNVLNLAFVDRWLRDVFCSLLEPYTLPDKVAIEVVPGVLRGLDRPEGVLTVHLIEAENVPKGDLFKWGDPYIVLYLSPHRPLQSTIANSTRHPVWDETFQLLVSDYRQDVLTVILYDHDRVTPDERLGRADYPVKNIQDGEKKDLWQNMREGSACTRGEGIESIDKAAKKNKPGKVGKGFGRAHEKALRKGNKGPCRIHIEVQYFSFEGGVLERTLHAQLGDLEASDWAAEASLAAAASSAQGTPRPDAQLPAEPAPDQHAAESDAASRDASQAAVAQGRRPQGAESAAPKAHQHAMKLGRRVHYPHPLKAKIGPRGAPHTDQHLPEPAQAAGGHRPHHHAAHVAETAHPGHAHRHHHYRAESARPEQVPAAFARDSTALRQALPRPRNQQDQTIYGILTGGILIIHVRDLEALRTRFWKHYCLKRLQVIVTVCGITKTTGYIRLGPHMPDIILVKQEMEYQLTGDQVNRRGGVVHFEVWDTLTPKTFMGEANIPLSEVTAKRRLHGEWPLAGVKSGCMGLDMSWTSTLQRLRGRPPRRLGQTHGTQQSGPDARHT